ncbi:hypothetical protein JRG19_02495 [Pseudoclavibacter alba]|uniref:hypothetical protein n=1 Tax=Pseudoclavibacter albus TaxID=272241 RepID=UPI0019CFED49|nr:hypothetical protein [Pseudoclavibacter alba]MBN6777420.1 hypothetical protein [Pseudoclavibacter alba]
MSWNVTTRDVTEIVERYVERELRLVAEQEHREHMDEEAINALHDLAGLIYRAGFEDGMSVMSRRASERLVRERKQ